MKDVFWVGSSNADWDAFPQSARNEAGYQLDKVQRGLQPSDWKPMSTVAAGVCELRIRDATGAFLAIYLADPAGRHLRAACVSEKDTENEST